MMQFSYGYFAFFHADAEHPDWAPLWNPVYTLQPNPDDIYLYCPISSDYQLPDQRQSRHGVHDHLHHPAQPARACPGRTTSSGPITTTSTAATCRSTADGSFELLLSTERPAGHTGNWLKIAPGRARADDPLPQLRLGERDRSGDVDRVPRSGPAQEAPDARGDPRAHRPHGVRCRCARRKMFYAMQNGDARAGRRQRLRAGPMLGGSFTRQIYLPAVFEFEDDEALIVETELPRRCALLELPAQRPLFQRGRVRLSPVEHQRPLRQAQLATASSARSSRSRTRACRTGSIRRGFKQGTIYGRWYDCDSCPTPTMKRVKLRSSATTCRPTRRS